MKSIVVTGVSSGIGLSITRLFIKNGYRVFGSVRNDEDAERLSLEFGSNFIPLIFDITDVMAIQKASEIVQTLLEGSKLFALINNAGIVVNGPLMNISSENFSRQLEVNIIGPFNVTKAFVPLLGSDKNLSGSPGRVINIGSASGIFAVPFMGPYTASKFGLEGLNDSFRRELFLYGIDVILVGPGPVKTPIMEKMKKSLPVDVTDYSESLIKYQKMSNGAVDTAMSPEKISENVWGILNSKKPKVRYSVIQSGLKPFLLLKIPLYLPKRLVDRMFAKMLGFTIS